MSTSESFAVSMMIGTAERVRICRHTSVPGMPGQHQVEQHEVGAAPAEQRRARRAVLGDRDLVALAVQQVRERLGEIGFVLDEQDAGHTRSPDRCGRRRGGRAAREAGAPAARSCLLRFCFLLATPRRPPRIGISGSRMVNVEPRPGRDQTRTSPPWFCAACFTMRGRARCRRCGGIAPGRRGRSARTRGRGRPRGCRCPGRRRRSRRRRRGSARRRRRGTVAARTGWRSRRGCTAVDEHAPSPSTHAPASRRGSPRPRGRRRTAMRSTVAATHVVERHGLAPLQRVGALQAGELDDLPASAGRAARPRWSRAAKRRT